jgi:hypothetical protein
MRWVREHLTYANVMVTILAFIVLGGGVAYGVKLAKKNSVTSKSVKNGSLKGLDVLDDSLTGQDVSEGTLNLPAGQQGPKGDAGTKGDKGDQGVPGPATTAGVNLAAPTPAATPDQLGIVAVATVEAPAPGKILVMFNASKALLGCSDASNPRVGLYVDSIPVPNSGNDQPLPHSADTTTNANPTDVTLLGVTGPVTAGSHTIQVGGDCPGPASTLFLQSFQGPSSLGGIFLGS